MADRSYAELQRGERALHECVARQFAVPVAPELAAPLVECLKDENREVRLQAAYALCQLSEPTSAEPLLAIVTDLPPLERGRIERFLVRMGPAAWPIRGLASSACHCTTMGMTHSGPSSAVTLPDGGWSRRIPEL